MTAGGISLGHGAAFLVFSMSLSLAHAQQRDGNQERRVGDDTRTWLAQQASGAQADNVAQPGQDGNVAAQVYQRYLDSFTHPIPERFRREAFSGDGDS